MQYALSPSGLHELTLLSRERTLYAFDFDGTLSPIVQHPEQAGIHERTRRLLSSLAEASPCVVVSGRARADLLGRLEGIGLTQVIGNHGAETEKASRVPRARIAHWKDVLDLELGSLPGVWVEDKGLSLAVHYRQAAENGDARRRILATARKLERVRVFGGKRVVNLVPEHAPHKGSALAAERDRLGCNWVLYVGDDETDEDAFSLGGNTVPVRIGRKLHSHARYYLRTQREIDRLLEVLVRKTNPRRRILRTPVPVSRAMRVDRT
jgi:trehalose 6-phosphate phosphatase